MAQWDDPECVAEEWMQGRRYYEEVVRPDRDHELFLLREKAIRIGDVDALERTRPIKDFGATVDEVYRNHAVDVKAAMVDLGFDASVVRAAWVGTVLDTEVTADIRGIVDRSSLVLVSDEMWGLGHLYARHIARRLAELMQVPRPDLWTAAHHMEKTLDTGLDRDLLAGALRYYNIHQRVFRSSGKVTLRLTPAAERVALLLSRLSMHFVIAHELAHHVLGHVSYGGENISPHTPEAEAEADRVAYQVTALTAEKLGLPVQTVGLGVLISLVAIYCAERAHFVRPGVTHPPASERMERLWQVVPEADLPAVNLFVYNLLTVTDLAADFSPGPRRVTWKYTLEHPDTYSPHPSSYINFTIRLDRLQSAQPESLVDILHKWDEKYQTTTSGGAVAAASGDIELALREWGMKDDKIARIVSGGPLLFHTLQDDLRSAMTNRGEIGNDVWRLIAVSAACLVQDKLG